MGGKDRFVSEGNITIMLLNVYSSLVLKTRLSTVVFDPVKMNLDKHTFDAQGVDAIIITHEHADHFDEKLALEMQGRSGAPIITTPFLAQKLTRVRGKAQGLRVGELVKIKDIILCAEHCVHPAHQPISFIVRTDAVTLYHPADSKPFPGMKEIQDKYEPDVMLYMGTSKEGLRRIAEMVRPNIVVSYFAPRFADLEIPGVALKMVKQFEAFTYP